MNKIKLSGFSLLCAFCVLALSACRNVRKEYVSPVFSKTEKLASNRISAEGMILYIPFGMFVEGDYIYVLALVEHKWLQVYDKHSGELVKQLLTEGQGPGEVISGFMMDYNTSSHTLSIYDQAQRKHLFYRVDEKGELTLLQEKRLNFTGIYGIIRRMWPLNEQLSLVDGQLDSVPSKLPVGNNLKRFQLLADEKIVGSYNEFPIEGVDKRSFLDLSVSLSPDRQRMALGTRKGAILETFDISADGVKLRNTRKFYPANLDPETFVETPETKVGFLSVCATEDKIYTVFGEPDEKTQHVNTISVFDWDGKELVQYETDCNLYSLYYTPQEPSKLYGIAVSEDSDFYLVSFDLPEELQ